MSLKKNKENKKLLSELDKLQYEIANEANYNRKNENYDKKRDKP